MPVVVRVLVARTVRERGVAPHKGAATHAHEGLSYIELGDVGQATFYEGVKDVHFYDDYS